MEVKVGSYWRNNGYWDTIMRVVEVSQEKVGYTYMRAGIVSLIGDTFSRSPEYFVENNNLLGRLESLVLFGEAERHTMKLYKITFGMKKKFYESEDAFERYWKDHSNHYKRSYDIVAYEIDWSNQCWKEIRRQNKV